MELHAHNHSMESQCGNTQARHAKLGKANAETHKQGMQTNKESKCGNAQTKHAQMRKQVPQM